MSLILAGALGIRLLGVGRGLPYLHEGDEVTILSGVIGMLQRGDLNPAVFTYPSVYYYLLLPVMYLHYVYLHARGALSSPLDIQLFHPHGVVSWYLSPASFYLWGRTLAVLIGTATVYLVYRIGKTAYGTAAGLLAAAFLALAPGAVYFSDTVRVDIPMAFFVTLTVLCGLGIIRRGRWQDYLLSGLLAGIAVSTKTNAAAVVPALLVAHLVSPHRRHLVDLRLMGMGCSVLVGVVVGTPYVILTPHSVIAAQREQALYYVIVPSFTWMRHVLPGYLAYFVRPSQGDDWSVIPHAAMGLLPALAASVGTVAGFRWNPRLHLYLLSFPVPYFLFMLSQKVLGLRLMMAVLPFAALFAAVGCLNAWRWVQTRWPAPRALRARSLAGLVLVALLAAPGRDAIALGWTLGQRPDTRAAAVEWLRRNASPGARIAFGQDLGWYIPDLERLPFTIHFVPPETQLGWYLQQHIDFAVIGDHSTLRSLRAVAVLPQPTYQGGHGSGENGSPVLDPTLYIVRPEMPERTGAFPVSVGAGDTIPEPAVMHAVGTYSETVHLPTQRFASGSYRLTVTGEWPDPWPSLADTPMMLTAKVLVGRMTVGQLTLTDARALGFATPAFRIDQAETLPVKIEFTLRSGQRQPDRGGWALGPSVGGCAIARDVPSLNIRQMTLEAWVYLEGIPEPPGGGWAGWLWDAPILSKGEHVGYYLELIGDRTDRIAAALSVAGRFHVGRAGFVPVRQWTHIAATYDGHEARIYLNGMPTKPEADPRHEGAVHAEGAPLAIGCRNPGTPDETVFKGLITGARIWNRVLSPDAIRDEAGSHRLADTSAGLVGSWSFQSLVRGMVPDLSGAGNNLAVKALRRIPIQSGPFARLAWTGRDLNLLRVVTIERVMP